MAITIINFWWKISIHSVGAGALTALVLILSLKMYSPLVWYLIPVIIAGGLVLSSRLKLNYHTPQQVWVGLLTGFLGLGLFMWFF
jgi:membrane-associated phospholipid phosphatase